MRKDQTGTHEKREELDQRLEEARLRLEAARAETVELEAQTEKLESDVHAARSIGERSIEDLEGQAAAARDSGANNAKKLRQEVTRERSLLAEQLNDLESKLRVLRSEKIDANARQKASELEVQDLSTQLKALADEAIASDEQLRRADQLQERLAELETERDELSGQISAFAPVVDAQREAAGELGAKELAEHYANQAEQHGNDWRRWLRWLLLFGLLALVGGVGVVLVTHPVKEATNAEIASAITIDLLVLGLLLYAVRFSARQFSVHRHLQAVAQAKADALRTFKRMIVGPSEAEVRSAVSAVLAQAVFDSSVNGFIDGSGDNITLIERVVAPAAQRAAG
jgi:hypothetical protein